MSGPQEKMGKDRSAQRVARGQNVAGRDILKEKSFSTLSLEKPRHKAEAFWEIMSCLFMDT